MNDFEKLKSKIIKDIIRYFKEKKMYILILDGFDKYRDDSKFYYDFATWLKVKPVTTYIFNISTILYILQLPYMTVDKIKVELYKIIWDNLWKFKH